MVIGVPREVKSHEYRVAATPHGVRELVSAGHGVIVEHSAGLGSGFPDDEYERAGATLADGEELFGKADLIVKVKEPMPEEYDFLREGQAIFTFLHLASNRELTDFLLKKNITALGYETLEVRGTLPLLAPMSEIAGRMSPIVASFYLQKSCGGSGLLSPGVPGVPPAYALILGAGVVGTNAARIALALGMRVAVVNRGIERLRQLDELFGGLATTLPSASDTIAEQIRKADIVVGAVLIPGEKTPRLVTSGMVSTMKKGSVIVDVSVDQGGCVETTRPTTHDDPVYEAEGVVHYAVANMPGAYPRTATLALGGSTLPYVKRLADMGVERAMREDPSIQSAVNVHRGDILHRGLAESLGLPLGRPLEAMP